MAPSERRNLYRLLYVQPDAPHDVIKAAYRALMTTLRAHPDRGGSHDDAARLNAAWTVLGDPARRAAYDASLRRPGLRAVSSAAVAAAAAVRSAAKTAPASAAPVPTSSPASAVAAAAAAGAATETPLPVIDPQRWHLERCCPLCGTGFSLPAPPEPHCLHCGSPLTPAPADAPEGGELLGRRGGERYANANEAQLRLTATADPQPARLKDLSLTGLSFHCRQSIDPAQAFRVTAPGFDAIAAVVAQRPQGSGYTVHARLLTLQVLRSRAGTFVSTRA
jgi:curved DNA-binding protein CbpA